MPYNGCLLITHISSCLDKYHAKFEFGNGDSSQKKKVWVVKGPLHDSYQDNTHTNKSQALQNP